MQSRCQLRRIGLSKKVYNFRETRSHINKGDINTINTGARHQPNIKLARTHWFIASIMRLLFCNLV